MNQQIRGSQILIGFIICSIGLLSCTGSNVQAQKIQNNNAIIETGLISNIKETNKNNLKESKWQEVGKARFSPGGTDNEKIVTAPDGTLYVAFADYTQHNKLSVMRYDNNSMKWSNFGVTTISTADASDISMVAAPNGSVYIAFTDAGKNNKATVMTYDNTSSSWKTVGGDAISTGKAAFTNIIVDANSTPYLAYSDLDNGGKTKVVTYDKSSNTWKAVGTFATTAKSEFNNMAFAPDGTLYLICSMYDFNMGRALVKSYDKSSQQWNLVGDIALSNGIAQYTSIAISPTGVPYITFADQGNDGKAKVMAYDKTTNHWRVIGNSGISVGSSKYNNIAISHNGNIDVAFKDVGSNGQAIAISFDHTANEWKPLAGNSALISEGEASHISLAINKNGTPYIAYADNSAAGGKKATVIGSLPSWRYIGKPGISDGIAIQEQLFVASDGTIYIIFRDASHNDKVSVMTYNSNIAQWQNLGPTGFSDSFAVTDHLSAAYNKNLYLALEDLAYGHKASVITYNKSDNQWQYVGPRGFSDGSVDDESLVIAPDGTLYLAFADEAHGRKASVMTYNKNTNQWQYLGRTGLSDGAASFENLAIASDGTLYLAFSEVYLDNKPTVMVYNKKTDQWQHLGSPGFGGYTASYEKLVISPEGNIYITFTLGATAYGVTIMTYDKNTNQWQHLGNYKNYKDIGADQWNNSLAIDSDNNLYFAFQDCIHNDKASVMRYSKQTDKLQYLGQPGFSTPTAYENLAITADGTLYLAFLDGANGQKASVMAYY